MHGAPTFFTFGESCLLLMYGGQSTLSLHSVRYLFPSAFALDLLRFDVYTFPPRVVGATSFHDPFEGTETSDSLFSTCPSLLKNR